MDKNKPDLTGMRADSVQAATDSALLKGMDYSVSEAVRSICKYVNQTAGASVLSEQDNEIRRVLLECIGDYAIITANERNNRNEG